MKKILSIIFCFALASSQLYARGLKAIYSFSSFNTPENKPYVESYISISGYSITYRKTETGKYQGSVQVLMNVTKAGINVYTDKYNVLSPEQNDTINLSYNFIDQKRFELNNGEFVVNLTLTDNYQESNKFNSSEKLTINYETGKTTISDITLLESFKKTVSKTSISKNGYDLLPTVSNFLSSEFKNLGFYTEVYPASPINSKDNYLVSYNIEDFETGNKIEPFGKFSKMIAQFANPIIGEFAIETLPTGNYNLSVEVFTNKNELIATKKIFFQRLNSEYTDKINTDNLEFENSFVAKYSFEEIKEHVKSLTPISLQQDELYATNLLADPKEIFLKKYFLSFWQKKHGVSAEKEWEKYRLAVVRAEEKFGFGKTKGYQTPRGRIYLKYGAASVVNRNDGKSDISVPYEIWIYNTLGQNQSNRKFVFANFQDLAAGRYELIHSTAIGEVRDEKWQGLILGRNPVSNLRQDDFKEVNSSVSDSRGLDQLKRDFE